MLTLFKFLFLITLLLESTPNYANRFLDSYKPLTMESKNWNSLKSVITQNKILPRPIGIGGENSGLGFSLSAENNRVLIGAPGVLNRGAVYVFDLVGENWIQSSRLMPADLQFVNLFGNSVSLSGNYALIGAVNNYEHGSQSGAAYIFEYISGQWIEIQQLTVPELETNDKFGTSVSLSGNTALVGAIWDDDQFHDSGAVYVFNKISNGWINTTKLTNPNGKYFGVSISLNGNKALIGADDSLSKGLAYIYEFNGSTWQVNTTLSATNGFNGDSFGRSVSLLGDRAVVGAPFNNSSGAAYVFENINNSWIQTQKLSPSGGASGDFFGLSVSQSMQGILIGSMGDDDLGSNSGSVYVFENNNGFWAQTKIIASNGLANYRFGRFVYFYNDSLLIGSPGSGNINFPGLVYIYKKNAGTWSEITQLTILGAAGDKFGTSIDMHKNRAIIGAPYDDDKGSNSGALYVFEKINNKWIEDIKLLASDGKDDDKFGTTVSLFNDKIIVGAPQGYVNNISTGSLYVYTKNNNIWVEEKIFASDGLEFDNFGSSIDISEQFIIVGAPTAKNNGVFTGAAYIYQNINNQWLETKVLASDGTSNDRFGITVSIFGNYAAIAAVNDDDFANDSGSVYIFEFSNGNWNQVDKLTASDPSSNASFGRSIDISSDLLAIGSRNSLYGAIYIFKLNNNIWFESYKISGSSFNKRIGKNISLSGELLLAGDFSADSAYIFKESNNIWNMEEIISSPEILISDYFGFSIKFSGDNILIGSPQSDDRGTNSGAAYIFILQIFANGFE